MIEILKSGNRNVTLCLFCGSILSYQVDDIKEREVFLSPRQSDFVKYITCPKCKNKIDFKKGEQDEISTYKSC